MNSIDRSCGSCSLCCKVMGVRSLDKPRHQWCTHFAAGTGCTIYAERPDDCRTFHCMYVEPASRVAEHWFPAQSRMVLFAPDEDPPRIEVHVDAGGTGAWRRDPFLSDLRAWSRAALADEGQVLVFDPPHVFMILPDREIELNSMERGEVLLRVERRTASGMVELDVERVKADDPRLAAGRTD